MAVVGGRDCMNEEGGGTVAAAAGAWDDMPSIFSSDEAARLIAS